MVKPLHTLAALLFFIFHSSALAATFTAQVDRNEINEHDSFTLILRIDEQVFSKQPNLTPLSTDFRVLNQQRSQQYRAVNGKTESFTRWDITLSAQRTGTLVIPAITLGKHRTQPIHLTVLPLSEEAKQQAAQDYFFETKVTPERNAIVQGQLLYTEKFYYRYVHDRPSLSELNVTDAKVQPLGEVRTYNTTINGATFGVYERQYAIFPEVSGELVIPGTRFEAYSRSRGWESSRPIRVTAKPIRLTVASIPQDFPANSPWLASSKLTLEEQFSVPPSQWQAGEAITRTLTLRAQGIAGSALPDIVLPEVAGIRHYPDQSKVQDSINNLGILGSSEQSTAMMITQAGKIELPEVRLPWWNTETQKIEYAVIPARTLTVKGESASTSPANSAQTAISEQRQEETEEAPFTSTQTPTINTAFAPWMGGLVVAILLISVLLNLWLWARLQQLKKRFHAAGSFVQKAANQTKQPSANAQLKQAWQAFNQACKQHQPADIRHHLLAWFNAGGLSQISLNRPLTRLQPLAEQVQTPALKLALQELDATLYAAQENSAYNGMNLLNLIQEEQRLQPKPAEAQQAGLYPQ